MDKIINEISNIKVLNLKEYNNLISRYGINDVNLAFKQILNLSTKKQELLKLYSIAFIVIDITSQNKRNNIYGFLCNKYGQDVVDKFISEYEISILSFIETTSLKLDSINFFLAFSSPFLAAIAIAFSSSAFNKGKLPISLKYTLTESLSV